MSILRSMAAIFLALLAGGVVIGALEVAAWLLFPIPGITPKSTPEEIKAALAAAPASVRLPSMVIVLFAHAIGVFVGGWIAARIADRAKMAHALAIGGVFLLFGIINLAKIPHPLWFAICDIAVYLPGAWLGGRLARGK